MESEWRLNLWEYFGPSVGFLLCARIPQPNLFGQLWVKETPTRVRAWFHNGVPGHLPTPGNVFTVPAAARFPYGQDVVPDN